MTGQALVCDNHHGESSTPLLAIAGTARGREPWLLNSLCWLSGLYCLCPECWPPRPTNRSESSEASAAFPIKRVLRIGTTPGLARKSKQMAANNNTGREKMTEY